MSDEIEARIVAHLPYARAVASRAIDPRCRGADREDLIAWGILGLVQATSELVRIRFVALDLIRDAGLHSRGQVVRHKRGIAEVGPIRPDRDAVLVMASPRAEAHEPGRTVLGERSRKMVPEGRE